VPAGQNGLEDETLRSWCVPGRPRSPHPEGFRGLGEAGKAVKGDDAGIEARSGRHSQREGGQSGEQSVSERIG
jgi:hypothetical protein